MYLKCQERYAALSNMDELENEIDREPEMYEQLIDKNDMEEAEIAGPTAERAKDSNFTSAAPSPRYNARSFLKLDLPKFCENH